MDGMGIEPTSPRNLQDPMNGPKTTWVSNFLVGDSFLVGNFTAWKINMEPENQ